MTTNDNDNQEALENLKNEMRKMALQTKNMAEYLKKQKDEVESEEKTSLEEWQPIQTQYVSSYLEKCISRMNLHEESARYYTRRHYIIVIPATAMGVITSTAAFSQWSNNVLCGQTSWVMLLVGGMMALTTLLHNLSEFVFAYKDKARQHQQSYINFSRLVKRISNEYNNPVQEHKSKNEKRIKKGKKPKQARLKDKEKPTFRESLIEISEEPVIYDSVIAKQSSAQIKRYLFSKHFSRQ